nr:MAG TPA: hypothetical protein [Caudoviricetes sp.]
MILIYQEFLLFPSVFLYHHPKGHTSFELFLFL